MSSPRLAAAAAPFVLFFAIGAGQPIGDQRGTTGDHDAARFAHCAGSGRTTCVVDGDTFWYRGEKVRIADINAPETGTPQCSREAELGHRATARLTQLLNAGPFTLAAAERERDRYGRLLRVVTRRGASLGQALVGEGLAERWKGYRGSWC